MRVALCFRALAVASSCAIPLLLLAGCGGDEPARAAGSGAAASTTAGAGAGDTGATGTGASGGGASTGGSAGSGGASTACDPSDPSLTAEEKLLLELPADTWYEAAGTS